MNEMNDLTHHIKCKIVWLFYEGKLLKSDITELKQKEF